MMTYHVQFLLLVLAGWVNRQQQDVIDYQQEENRVLRAGLRGKRLSLSDDERRRLAVKAQALGREALAQIASVATPATLLRWYLSSAKKKIATRCDSLVAMERCLDFAPFAVARFCVPLSFAEPSLCCNVAIALSAARRFGFPRTWQGNTVQKRDATLPGKGLDPGLGKDGHQGGPGRTWTRTC